ASMLLQLKGIGTEFAAVLGCEGFFRHFDNRRQLAAYAGLAPTPWQSGSLAHGLRAHAVGTVARADRAILCCPSCDGGLRGGFRVDPVECRLPPLVQRVWRGRRAPHW